MSIVPEIAVAGHAPDIIVRPLRPQLSRTLALIEHRNKPNEPALEIVRNALLALRTNRDTGIDRKRRGPEESPAALRARRSTRRPRRNSALT